MSEKELSRKCMVCGAVEYKGKLYRSKSEVPESDIGCSDTVLSRDCFMKKYAKFFDPNEDHFEYEKCEVNSKNENNVTSY